MTTISFSNTNQKLFFKEFDTWKKLLNLRIGLGSLAVVAFIL